MGILAPERVATTSKRGPFRMLTADQESEIARLFADKRRLKMRNSDIAKMFGCSVSLVKLTARRCRPSQNGKAGK